MPAVRPKASVCSVMAASKLAVFWCSLRSAMKVPLRMKLPGTEATGSSCPSLAWPSRNSPASSGAQLALGSKGPGLILPEPRAAAGSSASTSWPVKTGSEMPSVKPKGSFGVGTSTPPGPVAMMVPESCQRSSSGARPSGRRPWPRSSAMRPLAKGCSVRPTSQRVQTSSSATGRPVAGSAWAFSETQTWIAFSSSRLASRQTVSQFSGALASRSPRMVLRAAMPSMNSSGISLRVETGSSSAFSPAQVKAMFSATAGLSRTGASFGVSLLRQGSAVVTAGRIWSTSQRAITQS
jgi:hypothetical protein